MALQSLDRLLPPFFGGAKNTEKTLTHQGKQELSRRAKAEEFVRHLAHEFRDADAQILNRGRRILVDSINLSPADRSRLFHWKSGDYALRTVDLSETNLYFFESSRKENDLR